MHLYLTSPTPSPAQQKQQFLTLLLQLVKKISREYQLAAILTILHEDYTRSEVQNTLQTLFEAQYELTVTEIVETRTRTEERTGTRTVWDPETQTYVEEGYTYEVEVEYEYYILQTTLTNATMDTVIRNMGLTADQMSRYELLLATYPFLC